MGRWAVTTTPMGALQLQTNTKTGRSKGVSKSGDKRTARVWCPRRKTQMHVGTFNSTPEAAAAIASAELLGPENLPTPAARKPRTKQSGAHFAAWRSPCRLVTECVCVWSCLVDLSSAAQSPRRGWGRSTPSCLTTSTCSSRSMACCRARRRATSGACAARAPRVMLPPCPQAASAPTRSPASRSSSARASRSSGARGRCLQGCVQRAHRTRLLQALPRALLRGGVLTDK